MFKITEYSVEAIADPFKILIGERFEYMLDLEVEEDDELYHDAGVRLRVVYAVSEGIGKVVKYEFQTGDTGKYIDFEMEDDELVMVEQYCQQIFNEA